MNAAELIDLTIHGLAMIEKIVGVLKDAHAGAVKPEDALAKIGALHQEILDDRAATDATLAARFKTP